MTQDETNPLQAHTEPQLVGATHTASAVAAMDLQTIVQKAKLDVPATEIQLLQTAGFSNTIYTLGDRYILRIAHDHPESIEAAYTESVAAPAVEAAGIKAPKLIVFDDSGEVVPTPYSIFEKVPGTTLFSLGGDPEAHADKYRAFGAELAKLHRGVTDCPDPDGRLDKPYRIDALGLVDELEQAGYISPDNARWLHEVFKRLEPAVKEAATFRRFLHADAHPDNIMFDGATLSGIIDWADAGWGDPAMEFTYIPTRAVPFALEGYRSVMPLDGDEGAEARILWDHLARAVVRLKRAPLPERADWMARPGGPLIELLTTVAKNSIPAWQQYLR